MRWVAKLLIDGLAVFLSAQFVPGIEVSGVGVAIIAAFVLSIINIVIRPVLVFLTLPINFITLGLFTFVINALMFWLTSAFIPGFDVSGFIAAFLGALILTVVSWLTNAILD